MASLGPNSWNGTRMNGSLDDAAGTEGPYPPLSAHMIWTTSSGPRGKRRWTIDPSPRGDYFSRAVFFKEAFQGFQ